MTRRRSLVLAAALAGVSLLALALALVPARRLEPRPTSHYRVELPVPPLEASLWFVTRYPRYFTSGEKGFETWLQSLDPRDRDFVLAMGQTLTWAWIDHELAQIETREIDPLVRAAILVIRQKTLNQLEISLDRPREDEGLDSWAYVGDTYFTAGVFARLVRGASNCEGQNHLVAVLVDAALDAEPWWMPDVGVDMAGLPGHEIIIIDALGLPQPVYVDGWSNLPPFSLDPSAPRVAPLLSELGDPPAGVVPDLPGQPPFASELYAKAWGVPLTLYPTRDAPARGVDLEVRAPSLDEASLAKIDDPWRLYLIARVLHLYDDPRAPELYREIYARFCPKARTPYDFVCTATWQMQGRFEPELGPWP